LIRGFKGRIKFQEFDAGLGHFGLDVGVDPIDLRLGEIASADAGLIGDHCNPPAGLMQPDERINTAGDWNELFS
jgi:hypothetical protein